MDKIEDKVMKLLHKADKELDKWARLMVDVQLMANVWPENFRTEFTLRDSARKRNLT